MRIRRLSVLPLMLLLTGALVASPAYAGSGDGPRCHIEFSPSEHHFLPPRGDFIVHSPGHRGAVGVWKDRSGDRLHVRVHAGEGTASKRLSQVKRREYELVRCETL